MINESYTMFFSVCTGDNHLAKTRGLSPHKSGQTIASLYFINKIYTIASITVEKIMPRFRLTLCFSCHVMVALCPIKYSAIIVDVDLMVY